MLFTILSIQAADCTGTRATALDVQMQDALMHIFYGPNDATFYRTAVSQPRTRICNDDDSSNRMGIVCTDGFITAISYDNANNPFFAVAYLPSSVRSVKLNGNKIESQIDTRRLPIALQLLSIRRNRIFGQFNLSTLPPNLRTLVASSNRIDSIGSLYRLPQKIERIDLSNNQIMASRVYYGDIPDSVKLITLNQNKVKKLRPMHKDHFDAARFGINNAAIYAKSLESYSSTHELSIDSQRWKGSTLSFSLV